MIDFKFVLVREVFKIVDFVLSIVANQILNFVYNASKYSVGSPNVVVIELLLLTHTCIHN